MQTPDTLAIIAFYQRKDQLDRCMDALSKSAHPVATCVHDNTEENLGFTKACNIGLRAALVNRIKYALLLNQDCYVFPDTIGKLVAFMESHPSCAICGPKQLWGTDTDLIIHAGMREAYPEGRAVNGRNSAGDCAVSGRVPWVNGAAMMIRTAALMEFGLMDQNMILVGSDSDLCYTARARGFDVWYCAEAECIHEHGTTFATEDPDVIARIRDDMLYWRDKWLGPNLYARLLTAE